MRTLWAVLAALALTACIEQNTRWDAPEASSSTGNGSSGGGAETSSTTAASTDDGGSTSTAGADTTSSTSSSTSSSSADEEMQCEGNWHRVCDGECRDTKRDPHACGLGCADCTELFGPHARCKTGLCQPPGGGGGDD